MKVTKEFKRFIGKASKLTSTRNPAIMSYVNFTNKRTVEALNFTVEMTLTLTENHNLKGVCLRIQDIKDILKVWKDFEIIQEDEKIYAVKDGIKKQFIIREYSKNFPELHSTQIQAYQDIPLNLFDAYVKASQFVSKDVLKPAFCGVFFDKDSAVCATNGYMLYLQEASGFEIKFPNIIAVHSILQNLKAIKLRMTEDGLFIITQYVTYFVKKINSVFPKYAKVIPDFTKNYSTISFKKNLLTKVTDIHKFMKIGKMKENHLILTNNKIGYSTLGNSQFTYEEPFDFVAENEFKFVVNITYFKTFLKNMNFFLNSGTIKYRDKYKAIGAISNFELMLLMPIAIE